MKLFIMQPSASSSLLGANILFVNYYMPQKLCIIS